MESNLTVLQMSNISYSEGNGKNTNLSDFGKQYFDCLPQN